MSPIGGVGINLAIQDAVAAANPLAGKLRAGTVGADDLDAVRRRRLWPTMATQRLQVAIQDNVLAPVLSGANPSSIRRSPCASFLRCRRCRAAWHACSGSASGPSTYRPRTSFSLEHRMAQAASARVCLLEPLPPD